MGVRYERSLGLLENHAIGREFRHASIWHSSVLNSSTASVWTLITLRRWSCTLPLPTTLCRNWAHPEAWISIQSDWLPKCQRSKDLKLLLWNNVPMINQPQLKLVPLSLITSEGSLRRADNRLKAAQEAWTSSKWMSHLDKFIDPTSSTNQLERRVFRGYANLPKYFLSICHHQKSVSTPKQNDRGFISLA